MIGRIVEWIREQYDKVLAVFVALALLASLLYLALQAGSMRKQQATFDTEIDSWRPAYPKAAKASMAPYDAIQELSEKPYQSLSATSEASVVMFASEKRVWCIDCKRPIPYKAKVCPFCEREQPPAFEEAGGGDKDGDGIPDVLEQQYGLDFNNPDDAKLDKDKDGFTNIEEYKWKPRTDLTNAASHPPYAEKIVLEKLERDPFKLLYKGEISPPDGGEKIFQLNLRGDTKTYFARLSDTNTIEGFKLIKYEEKIEKDPKKPGIEKDVSILTLQKGNEQIPLVKNRAVQRMEYNITLRFLVDNTLLKGKIGAKFDVRDESYIIKEVKVDSRDESVVLGRVQDGVEFTVGKASSSKQEKKASGGELKDLIEDTGEGKK